MYGINEYNCDRQKRNTHTHTVDTDGERQRRRQINQNTSGKIYIVRGFH